MPQPTITLKIHRYTPLALVYLFVNSVRVLPFGLLITSILSPLLYLWLLMRGRRKIISWFVLCVAPFALIHLAQGADRKAYAVSALLAFTIYVTVYAFAVGLARIEDLGRLMQSLIVTNFLLACIGMALRFSSYSELMWRERDSITLGVDPMPRFQMFTYEPSHYSTLIAPLALYAFWRVVKRPSTGAFISLGMVVVPLAMSYSFGVLASLALAVAVYYMRYLRQMLRHRAVLVTAIALVLGFYLLPEDTALKVRLANVLEGTDSSGQARTFLSYASGYSMAVSRSLWFGVGFGQIKLIASEFLVWDGGRIPCAIAETLAQFGVVGVALRLAAQVFLFFKTRAYGNSYRLSIFLFVFIYQFTGSFTTNLAEYVAWTLAFSDVLPEFANAPAADRTHDGSLIAVPATNLAVLQQ